MYLKPAPGRSIVDPARMKHGRSQAILPESGRNLPDSDYWLRRLRAGDVVKVDPPEESVPTDSDPTPAAQPLPAKPEA